MRLKINYLVVIILSLLVCSCSNSNSDILTEDEEESSLYPTVVKGKVAGEGVFIKDKPNTIAASILGILHTYPRNIIAKEYIYKLYIHISNDVVIVLNLSNPIINGTEFKLKSSYSSNEHYDNYIY